MVDDPLTEIPDFLKRANWTEEQKRTHELYMLDLDEKEREKRNKDRQKILDDKRIKSEYTASRLQARREKKEARNLRRSRRNEIRAAVLAAIKFDSKNTLLSLQTHLTDYTNREIKSAVRSLTRNHTIIREGKEFRNA